MVRRSSPAGQVNDRAFPIRIKLRVPETGLRDVPAMLEWLKQEVGAGQFATHGAVNGALNASPFYFRRIEDAQRFHEAFPDAELADDVDRFGVR